MMNSGEHGLATILDVLIDSQLFPPDQIKIMEDYFDGKADAVSLGKLEEQILRPMAGGLMGELRWLHGQVRQECHVVASIIGCSVIP